MNKMDLTKSLIAQSSTREKADRVIKNRIGITNIEKKIAYLVDTFNVEIPYPSSSQDENYWAIIAIVMNSQRAESSKNEIDSRKVIIYG